MCLIEYIIPILRSWIFVHTALKICIFVYFYIMEVSLPWSRYSVLATTQYDVWSSDKFSIIHICLIINIHIEMYTIVIIVLVELPFFWFWTLVAKSSSGSLNCIGYWTICIYFVTIISHMLKVYLENHNLLTYDD